MEDRSLSKLIIQSFSDQQFTKGDSTRNFTLPINPETFSQSFKVSVDSTTAKGNPGSDVKYISTDPEELRLEFILDGTNTMLGYTLKDIPVSEQLTNFKKCVYEMDGKIHMPRFLIVQWGTEINFRCLLSSLELNYTLFNPSGSPLRVKVNATFIEYKSKAEIQAKAGKKSPDLTHYKKVKQGNRLDLMTFSVYNNSKYFLQVGKVNSLVNLRSLQPGTDLLFPPLDKNEA